MNSRWRVLLGAVLALPLILPQAARAETFPDHPVRIVVPFTAGGIVDSVARMMGAKLSTTWGQSVLIENKAGAGGSIGTAVVAKAPSDGYTMLMLGTGFTVLPSIVRNLDWSPSDFRAVIGIGSVPNIFVVKADSPIKDAADLIESARRDPGSVSYGSPGVGSSPYLSGELLAQVAGVKMTHIPYRGQAEAVNDLLGGRLTTMALTAALALPQIKAGKLRALGVTSPKPIAALPDVPTMAEAAHLPGYEVQPWTGVFVPKATPQPIVDKLAADMQAVLAMPDIKERMAGIGMELQPRPTTEFDAFIAAEIGRWAGVLQKAGVKAQ